MIVLNFAHPFTEDQIRVIEELTGRQVDKVLEIPVQFDSEQPFLPQLEALMSRIPIEPQRLQTEPILLNPPALNYIAAMVLAELHGRMGYFPPIVRIRPVQDSVPQTYAVAETINLQAIRDRAREKRSITD